MKTAYINGIVYTGEEKQNGKAILVKDGLVENITDTSGISSEYEVKDLKGLHIAPAFIDLQIYGGNGKLFSADLDVEAVKATYDYCLAGGCTHFMITMATNTIEV
ncbi:MAG: N-acetylglucosamine-6-phosphate deacetylase, partial [Agriterribacter sp.]